MVCSNKAEFQPSGLGFGVWGFGFVVSISTWIPEIRPYQPFNDACLQTQILELLHVLLHWLHHWSPFRSQSQSDLQSQVFSTNAGMATSSTPTFTPARDYSLEKDEQSQQEVFRPSSESSKAYPKEVSTDEILVEGGQWVTGLPLFSILGAICLVCFLMLLDISIIVTAIPQITSDFHSLEDVGWYGSAYQLARCVLF